MKRLEALVFMPIILTVLVVGVFFYIDSKKTEFSTQLLEKNSSYTKERVIFDSNGKNIYGLLIIPTSKTKTPAVIVLPAAAATKESREWYAEMFMKIGYSTMILDQRGIGETGGNVPSMPEDYELFRNGKKASQQLFVDDVIKAVNVLSQIKEIDSKRIAVLGESMGGRYAIIAAAKDKRLKVAFIISSSGYRGNYGDEDFNSFIASINPNEFIGKITPRKVIMFHSDNDSVIMLEDAQYTYSLANHPKEFVLVNGCEHGYCDQMYEKLKANLQEAFKA